MTPQRIAASLALLVTAAAIVGTMNFGRSDRPLPTGKWISPEGNQTEVGSFPANLALSPDGRFVVSTNTGFRQYLVVMDAETGDRVSQIDFNSNGRTLYYGLAFTKRGSQTLLNVSRGAEDLVSVYELSAEGTLTLVKDLHNPAPTSDGIPHHIAGVASSSDGRFVYAVNNQTHRKNGMRGSVSVINFETDQVVRKIPVGGFPLAIAAVTEGKWKDHRLFVTSERDGLVSVLDPENDAVSQTIETGSLPAYLRLSADQTRLYVANSGSDTISEIDTDTLKVLRTFLVRPAAYRGLHGSTPLGMDLTPNGKQLFVAMADLNAVAVVDLDKGELAGYIPAGWYPTSVAASKDGDRLFVSNAKGVKVRNPNATPVRRNGQYGPNIIEGTVSNFDLSAELGNLSQHTDQVIANNRATPEDVLATTAAFRNPGIEHVVYVIKENRTYDQVLGDLPHGNGDARLTLFPRAVTPNQHALAERFALLDDFYVCAEVSADGWNWSTSGMANEYTERNVFTNYSDRGRDYDFEGTNNGVAMDLRDERDVATAEGGYIWDSVLKAGKSIRNYGMFVGFEEGPRPETRILPGGGDATKKALQGVTSEDFRRYDMAYADSEAWVEYGLPRAPRQLGEHGSKKDPARMTTWKREFAEMVKKGKMPNLMLLRLGRDHTSGTTPGQYSPRACVADNDYAVGQLVDTISHSPFWKKTAIFIVEDDAQAGFDHVDSHRSTAYVISPFVMQKNPVRDFYNTDSVLSTICLLLGASPMNQYVATAPPFRFLDRRAINAKPYTAIRPAREIIAEVNRPTAYRAADSARLIDPLQEESAPDIELNDILWGSIKGPHTPRPRTPMVRYRAD